MSISLSQTLLDNSNFRKTTFNLLNNNVIKNCLFYSTENGPKIDIPTLQTKEILKNGSNVTDENKSFNNKPSSQNNNINNSKKEVEETIPITKKQNKKFTSGDNTKYYVLGAIGLLNLIPLYYILRRRDTLNDYDSSDVSRVKEVQKNYDSNMRQQIATYLYSIQNDLVRDIEEIDPQISFNRSNWNQRSKNSTGGGTNCNFENGKVFEKAVVQVNVESGSLSPFQVVELLTTKPAIQILSKSLNDKFSYYKASLSSTLYPQNPHVPTAFLDLAYHEIKNTSTGKIYWWFSGGNDLSETNLYLGPQDELLTSDKDELLSDYFQKFRDELEEYDPEYFQAFVKEGKTATYLSHRDEVRGVGGLYFNDLNNNKPQTLLSTVIQCFARKTLEYYKPIITKRSRLSWTLADKEKQAIKHSRLAEFELVSKLASKVDDSSINKFDKALPHLPLNVTWKKASNEMEN